MLFRRVLQCPCSCIGVEFHSALDRRVEKRQVEVQIKNLLDTDVGLLMHTTRNRFQITQPAPN